MLVALCALTSGTFLRQKLVNHCVLRDTFAQTCWSMCQRVTSCCEKQNRYKDSLVCGENRVSWKSFMIHVEEILLSCY